MVVSPCDAPPSCDVAGRMCALAPSCSEPVIVDRSARTAARASIARGVLFDAFAAWTSGMGVARDVEFRRLARSNCRSSIGNGRETFSPSKSFIQLTSRSCCQSSPQSAHGGALKCQSTGQPPSSTLRSETHIPPDKGSREGPCSAWLQRMIFLQPVTVTIVYKCDLSAPIFAALHYE